MFDRAAASQTDSNTDKVSNATEEHQQNASSGALVIV
jgi:hypothetical protein